MAFPPPHSFMFHSSRLPDHQDQAPPHHFHGGRLPFAMKRSTSFSGVEHQNNFDEVFGDDGLSDDGSQLGEKKKRLNIEQVKALEKSFELGNKLEPERKVQLAKALGMQPRQIAIWFQNRRARWKTKQLEKDYEVFKKQFDALKADNDALQAQHTKLNAELMALKSRDSSNASSENIADVNLGISRTPLMSSPVSSQLSGKNLFPMSHQPHQDTSRSNSLHCLKINDDHDHHQVLHQDHEHSFNIMFNSIDDQQDGFWPWPDHHHQQQQQNNFH